MKQQQGSTLGEALLLWYLVVYSVVGLSPGPGFRFPRGESPEVLPSTFFMRRNRAKIL